MFLAPAGAAPSTGGCATAARAMERRASIVEDDFQGFRWQRTRALSALHLFVPTLAESEPFID